MAKFRLKENHTYEKGDVHFGFWLQTRNSDSDRKSNLVNIKFWRKSYWFEIPELIQPRLKLVKYKDRDNNPRQYHETIEKSYGFSADKTSLHVHYGIQPGSWSRDDPKNSDHSKVFFYPWTEHDMVRHDYFNEDGSLAYATKQSNGRKYFDQLEEARKAVQKKHFSFNDYDGEALVATCYIEEREWRRGIGFFKFLRLLIKPKIRRSMNIEFSGETGSRKGSWKGGTIGHSIDTSKGETMLSAFTRYAEEHNMSNVKELDHYEKPPRKSNDSDTTQCAAANDTRL